MPATLLDASGAQAAMTIERGRVTSGRRSSPRAIAFSIAARKRASIAISRSRLYSPTTSSPGWNGVALAGDLRLRLTDSFAVRGHRARNAGREGGHSGREAKPDHRER